jgi:hypothetical protein
MGGGTSALIPAFSPRRRRIIVRRPAKLGELEVRTVCGLTIRDTADCQSALLKQTGTSRFVGLKNQRQLGGVCARGRARSGVMARAG